ncbi:hypothetical protein K523DRAFT_325746 [Schizophyllum commune Tattone D]|nr:hypothetical protein K523DRAFT_325746 [Schizophyllum commune Tattone D]
MVGDAFVWRCSKVGCPDPDFPKDYKAEHCTSSRGPAMCKSMRHGWKYHYKQVTVPWKGGKATLVRDKITGLFHCPCGAPSHACKDGQRMFRLCKRRVHPSTNSDVAKATVNEQDASAEEDDDDGDESQPCILISSSPSPVASTPSTLNLTSSATAYQTAEVSSSRAGSATRTRHKTSLSTYAPASRQFKRKRARSVSSSGQDSQNSQGEEDSQILALKQEFRKVRQERAAMWRRLIDNEKEELRKDKKRAKLG